MRINNLSLLLVLIFSIGISSCATKKRKDDVSGFKKFYHTFTSKYNGYFNANELMEESIAILEASHQDNYNQILPIYPVVDVDNPKMVAGELDVAIEKVTRVATIHDVGNYVDDCYVLMGQAQYLKQDYETAQETFEFFEQEFNPSNPYGKNFKKKKKTSKQKKREREIERENKKEKQEEEKKAREEKRKKEREEADNKREEEAKRKKKEREAKKKAREEEAKRKKKEREARKKSRKRGSKKRVKKEKVDTTETQTEIKEELPKVVEQEVVEKIAEDTGESVKITEVEEVEEEEYTPPKKEKDEEDDTSYSEGMLWLARTYIEREKYSNAEYLLRKLSQSSVNKEVERGIAPAKAHLYLRQKKYDDALPQLKLAIESADNGEKKARYAYIMAQLYQQRGNYAEALSAFQQVKDHKGDFRMDFNADLSIAKNGLLSGVDSESEASDKINKMLSEDKYEEFKDQVYFTLGEIALAQNNDTLALKNFTLSIRNNNGNDPLKTEAYYNMATLNYEKEMYVDAKYYYDSTLMTMKKLDERHLSVSNYARSLSSIAKYIETIELQDSLLALAELPEEELNKIADKLVLEQREKDKNSKPGAMDPSKKGKGGMFEDRGSRSSTRGFGSSKFFAYNLSAKEKGAREFNKRWGDRKLEDNWRRVDSQSFNSYDDEDNEDEEEIIEISDAERQRALADLPSSPAALNKANGKIEEALYQLGVAFRGEIKNYKKSVQALEQLVERYPTSEKILDAYYYLYLSYSDLGNMTKANYYKDKIISEFSDSKFAKALSDPNYLNSLKDEQNSVELYYDNTYAIFDSGDYESAKLRIAESATLFGKENPLKAKFGLLSAMITGSEEGKEGYIKALQDVITRYPNTAEQTRAREIMRFLRGDNDAFDVVEVKEVDAIFELEEDKLHYTAIVVYNADPAKFTNAKIAVSNFNKKYYKTKKLQLSDIFLNRDDGSQIILVRKFKNLTESMDYYNTVKKNSKDYIDEGEVSFDVYPITQRNYRKIISERSSSKYRSWFEKNYLDKN